MTLSSLQDACVALLDATYPGTSPPHLAFAPGRVNLIGEHTDYNGGYVFPMALSGLGTVVGGRVSGSGSVSVVSSAEVTPPSVVWRNEGGDVSGLPQWARYVVGVVKCFEELVGRQVSVELAVCSNLPLGAGLSSSASLEVAVFTLLEALYDVTGLDPLEKVKACQKAEHRYANVPCGIMDQYIATLGQSGRALFIDCQTNESQVVPFGDASLELVVTDTHQKHELAGGEYAKRRGVCEAVAADMGVGCLAEVSLERLVKHFSRSEGNVGTLPAKSYPRARHVVTEIARARRGKECLEAGDIRQFGQLMNESHKSLSDDYQVSCPELDEVVGVAWATPGVLGSRMTGGGFGGCAITLVRAAAVGGLLERLKEKCPYSTSFSTTAGAGASAWKL